MCANKVKGYTLIEMIIALAIIGILASIAIPSYQQYRVRENRVEVQGAMLQIAQKLAAYKLVNNDYNTTLTNPGVYGLAVFPQTGDALYDLALDTTTVAGSWTLTATPKTGALQADNGAVLLNNDGWRCWTKTPSPCTLTATSKWE